MNSLLLSYRRAKLSHDPNNTTWTRATTNYGHQRLLAQGWKPGTNLGAAGASYAQYHTEASASHIRVNHTVDNLGLGAGQGNGLQSTQCTGLDAFQDLLGRLNGKSDEELGREQRVRDNLKATFYAESKWGGLRFVSGGFLVGTKQAAFEDDQSRRSAEVVDGVVRAAPLSVTEISDPDHVSPTEEENRSSTVTNSEISKDETKKECQQPSALESPEKAQRRAEKAQRKLDRRKRREAKEARRKVHLARQLDQEISDAQLQEASVPEIASVKTQSLLVTKAISPVQQPKVLQASHATFQRGRHAVRQRHIQHKKMAIMNPKALDEVSLQGFNLSISS